MSLFPEPEYIHAHCDGGSRGNPGPSGYGAVVTDAQGRKLAELSEYLGIRTNNYAEYSGLLAVLAWALANGHGRLKVVSDSELMVKQIQGRYKVNSPDLKPLWAEARARIARLDKFEITHALRHKNKDADALANQAMDRGTGRGPARGPAADTPVQSLPLRPSQPPAAKPTPSSFAEGGGPASSSSAAPPSAAKALSSRGEAQGSASATMHRGFTRNGVVHLLGTAKLPDGIFVKIIPE